MILSARDLSFSYSKGRTIFEHVNFSVDRGEILTILGPNGAGKSTLLNCLANLLVPKTGELLIDGKHFSELGLRKTAQIMGYVPQNHTPAYAYTVEDFVVMGRAPYLGMMQRPTEKDYELTREVLADLNIDHLACIPYTEISGGERQQVMIARAIVQQPQILMFDEPTNHLDYGNQLRTISMIRSLANRGYAVILTTHMPDHAILLNGKVGVLDRSGHLAVGTAEETLTEDGLRNLYQSDLHIIYVEELGRNVCVAGALESATKREG